MERIAKALMSSESAIIIAAAGICLVALLIQAEPDSAQTGPQEKLIVGSAMNDGVLVLEEDKVNAYYPERALFSSHKDGVNG